MGFFTHSIAGKAKSVICFGVPDLLHDQIRAALTPPAQSPDVHDHFSIHTSLTYEIIKLYDFSVWALRDAIRDIELVDLQSCTTLQQTPPVHRILTL
jgi:hypothetical protein